MLVRTSTARDSLAAMRGARDCLSRLPRRGGQGDSDIDRQLRRLESAIARLAAELDTTAAPTPAPEKTA